MPGFHRAVNRVIAKRMQKTKVSIQVNNSAVAPNTRVDNTLGVGSDTTRANYYDTYVKPFSKIMQIEIDLQIYQSGGTVDAHGYAHWAFWKSPGGGVSPGNAVTGGTGLTFIPYTFRNGTGSIPMLSSTGLPCIYHLHGVIKIPKRFQTMAPGDVLYFSWMPGLAASCQADCVGRVNYMFKV